MATKECERAKHYKRQDQPGSHHDAGFFVISCTISQRRCVLPRVARKTSATGIYRVGHLLQDRHKSFPVEEDAYFLATLRNIHQNPLRAGLWLVPLPSIRGVHISHQEELDPFGHCPCRDSGHPLQNPFLPMTSKV